MQKILETERLMLRVFEDDDLDAFAALEADPDVMKYFTSGPRSRERAARGVAWFKDLQEQYGYSLWAVIDKSDDTFLGYCGLVPQTINGKEEVEVGYKLDKRYWRRGLATEAAIAVRIWGFSNLRVPRLISIIDPRNTASIRVAEKNGMRFTVDVEYDSKVCHVYAIDRLEPGGIVSTS